MSQHNNKPTDRIDSFSLEFEAFLSELEKHVMPGSNLPDAIAILRESSKGGNYNLVKLESLRDDLRQRNQTEVADQIEYFITLFKRRK